MQTTRRQFIKSGLGCALGMTLSRMTTIAASPEKKISIGFQLYTVRGEFARDVPATLKTLGELGYKGVEFWGYDGTPNVYQKYPAAELRKLLDEHGLKCCGMHLNLKALAKEKMGSETSIGELADILNQTAVELQKHKMTVGYHAHPFDFAKINGRFAWELLFSRTKPEVNMQMDVGNCLSGDGDPIAMLKKFPGRTRSIHIKEHKEKTFESDFYKQVFELCETKHPIKWHLDEMGGSNGNGFDARTEALATL